MTVDKYIDEYMPALHGWCEAEKARNMAKYIWSIEPKVCLEIGVFAGRSLFVTALALKHLGRGFAYGIEPWKPEPCQQGLADDDANSKWWGELDHQHIRDYFHSHREALGLNEWCAVEQATSQEALSRWKSQSPIDFLHIDGNHSEEVSCFDVDNYVPLVRPGGIVVFDDVNWDSTKEAQRRLLQKCECVTMFDTYGIYEAKPYESVAG